MSRRFSINVLLILSLYTIFLVGISFYIWSDYDQSEYNKIKAEILLREGDITLTK